MKNPRIKSKSGFTIVELLITTTILSVILVGASFVVVQIGRLYYKGVITSRTQNTARNVADSITRPLQLNGSNFQDASPVPLAGQTNTAATQTVWQAFCIGRQRFTYAPLMRVQQTASIAPGVTRQGLWADNVPNAGACENNINLNTNPSNGQGLISENMQIIRLDVVPTGDLVTVSVAIAYTPDSNDLEVTTDPVTGRVSAQCRASLASSQFCAVAEYETTVNPR